MSYYPGAPPGSPMGRNFILNGDMAVDQNKAGGAYSSTSTEVYSLDQWRYAGATGSTGVFSVQRVASSAPGFPYSLNNVVTTTQASLAATDNFHIEYAIEANSIPLLQFGTANAVTVALSFWVYASTTGNYSVSLMEGTNSRSYVTTYNVAVANTWQKQTIIIPGDTSGTYQTGVGQFGLKVIWSLGVGSTYSTSTSETWQGAAYWNKTGSQQFITEANSSTLYITGVQFEIGKAATNFEYTAPSQMLLNLQRYYFKTFPQTTAVAQSAGAGGALTYLAQIASTTAGGGQMLKYPVQMSTTPTIVTYNPSAANANWRNSSAGSDSGSPTVFFSSVDGAYVYNPQVAGDLAAALLTIHLVADARLGGS